MLIVEIPIPLEARTSKDKVGDLVPMEAYYTAGYGCVAGKHTLMGPTMTYKFKGLDLGLDYDVLVRTSNGYANFRHKADRIIREKLERMYEREFLIYDVESLPDDIQSKIFDFMKVDWEAENLVFEMTRSGLAP